MKTFCISLCISLSAFNMHAQTADTVKSSNEKLIEYSSHTQTLVLGDEIPEFPGGYEEYIARNIKYPDYAIEHNITGVVHAQVFISAAGKVTDVKIKQGVHEVLDNEVIRILKAMPDWKPGKVDGLPVPVIMNIPVKFYLQSGKERRQKRREERRMRKSH